MTTRVLLQILTIMAVFPTLASAEKSASDHRPVISPDGDTVVFMSTREGGDWELFLIGTDGTGLEQLTRNPGWDGYAVWAPDGRSFIFDREAKDSRGAYKFELMTSAVNPFIVMDDAHFSPDGSKIAFAVAFDGGSALDVMELATGEVSRHVTSTQNLYGLDWSPDGRRIAYTDTPNDNPDGNAELYILDVANADVLQLTDDENYDHMPVWLPEGNSIMFSSYASGREEIYILDLEDGDVRKFPSGLQ